MDSNNIKDYLDGVYRRIVSSNPTLINWSKFIHDSFVIEVCDKCNFDVENLHSVFDKPFENNSIDEDEFDENGNRLLQTEFTLNTVYDVNQIKNLGWLTDELRQNLLLTGEVFKKTVLASQIKEGYSDKVIDEIQRNSLNILGRCNDPLNWGENKQGLVFGMVQSGKTASMISLMGLAKEAQYNLIIVLSGDKDSLRNQTQKRIDETFQKLYSPKFKSLTDKNDYGKIRKNKSAVDIWNTISEKPCYIVCVKKEQTNLINLLDDIKELIQMSSNGYFDFDIWSHFKTLIIDDEADYASQDSSSKKNTSIHRTLLELRDTIPLNTYVAYTATPQACIGADPKKDIGYPRDFIWLIDPARDEFGKTISYLGLEEYFVQFPEYITSILSDDAWPHYKKDEKGIKKGLYDPTTGEINDEKLAEAEFTAVSKLIASKDVFHKTSEFQKAIVDFIIGAAIRWFRYYKNLQITENFFIDKYPTIEEIEAIEKPGQKITKFGFKPFPYHAMMVNLSQMNKTQSVIIMLFEKIAVHLFEEFHLKGISADIFSKQISHQYEKSSVFEKLTPSRIELEHFLQIAIEICKKDIFGSGKFIYLLNSNDEGSTLNYDTPDPKVRPKKSSIFVGGLILSRGLTIENLSVSVYCRSQALSLGDTNLQMCRWFGHKKNYIDLVTLYYQSHNQELFSSIANADRELRDQFWYNIKNEIKPDCILLSLYNSPLFRATSPQKSKFLGKSKYSSFSGITVDLLEPYIHPNCIKNYDILNDFCSNNDNYDNWEKIHNKAAIVFKNIPASKFKDLLNQFQVADNAINFTPKKYLSYLEKWDNSPQINIAVFGWQPDETTGSGMPFEIKLVNRARKLYKNEDFAGLKTPEEFSEYFISNTDNKLARLRGGPSDPNNSEKYLGDIFIDKSTTFHVSNYKNRPTRRDKLMPILFICYLLDPNYVGRKEKHKFYLTKNDPRSRYIDSINPIVSFSVSTPVGGPMYEISTNKLIIPASDCFKEPQIDENENF